MAALLVEHDDSRVLELAHEIWRDAAHGDARRHDEDERIVAVEVFLHRFAQAPERLRPKDGMAAADKERGLIAKGEADPPRQLCACLGQRKDGRPHRLALRNMCENSGA